MSSTSDADLQGNFARTFGDSLNRFLREQGMTQSDAAKQLGLEKSGKARLNTYCHDSPKGARPKPDAEILYLLCTKLGFHFEYNGYRISAATLNGNGVKPPERKTEQLTLKFDRQFMLTDRQGTVNVSVNRPAGRIEVSVSLKATA